MKILHVVDSLPEKFNSKFLSFIEENLSTGYQHYCLPLLDRGDYDKENNIIYITTPKNKYQRLKALYQAFSDRKYDLIILHGLFFSSPYLISIWISSFLLRNKERVLWMAWGGDIYAYQKKRNSILRELIRKITIKRIRYVSALIKDELCLVETIYNSKHVKFDAFYPSPINYEVPKESHNYLPDFCLKNEYIILGNSGTKTNRHIEFFKDHINKIPENIKIYIPLAYGDPLYIKSVIDYCNRNHPNRCYFQIEMVAATTYASILYHSKSAIFYHDRQQGLGNILYLLWLEKPVFMYSNTMSFIFLQNKGFSVFDILEYQNIDDIVLNSENKALINYYFSDEMAKNKWLNLFRKIEAYKK